MPAVTAASCPAFWTWKARPQLPPRQAHFTHIDDNITSPKFDRNKILINTHPEHRDVWIWLIPFGDNRCSIGVVGTPDKLAGESEAVLKKFVYECPMLAEILDKAVWENDFPFAPSKATLPT